MSEVWASDLRHSVMFALRVVPSTVVAPLERELTLREEMRGVGMTLLR